VGKNNRHPSFSCLGENKGIKKNLVLFASDHIFILTK
jgi:hypothetical protein